MGDRQNATFLIDGSRSKLQKLLHSAADAAGDPHYIVIAANADGTPTEAAAKDLACGIVQALIGSQPLQPCDAAAAAL